jgi:hypothetical protein
MGALTVYKPKSDVSNASAIVNPQIRATSQMPSFASGNDYSTGLGEAFQRSEGYDPVGLWMNQYKPAIVPTTPPPPPRTNNTGSTNSTGSTGSTDSTDSTSSKTGMTAAEALALAKFNYEKQQDALKLAGLQNYADSGSYNSGFDNLLKMITTQGGISETGITKAYGRATDNINEGFNVAQGLGNSGYAALNKYLAENPNNPYAGMQASVGSAPDALSNYLSAYGVSDQPVQGQIQADQLQAQQGAGNFNNLINLLSSIAQSGASSRGAESAMGQNLFDTSLGQERAGYQSQASNAQAQALAALQQQMFQSQFGVEGDRNNLANQIAQALAAAGGKTNSPTTNPETSTNDFAAEVAAAYAPKEAAYNRPAQTNEEIAALRALQEAARQDEIRKAVSGRRGNGY